MNKELTWPILPQRIAVISSPSAAGYGDFMNQIQNNSYGYKIYTVLFPAAMQGDQTEQSIIHALDRINRHEELFDGVVIIRGGGATSDLNSFDSYPLAVNVAQFPLPVITGIGHERHRYRHGSQHTGKNPYGGSRMDYRSYARSRHICRQSVSHGKLRSP